MRYDCMPAVAIAHASLWPPIESQSVQLLIYIRACLLTQASECFPTESRGMVHGLSAAVGKLGALSADIVMGQVRAVQLPHVPSAVQVVDG